MPYFIFQKNSDNIEGSIYRIAENESDLNNLNIIKSDYKIIEDSQDNFNFVKYSLKYPIKYIQDEIIFIDTNIAFEKKENLKNYIDLCKNEIKTFLNVNINHPLFSKWDNYYNQLNTLNLDNINYPLDLSLEKYLDDLELTSLNTLQVP
jgi:hypothetical protein